LVGQALAIFGSFDRARAIAGLPAPPLDHDGDVVIGALRSLARSGVRLDAGTLSSMGESGLVSACIDLFGSVAGGAARAGLGPPPEPRRAPSQPQSAPQGGGHGQSGFAQPPISQDGVVPTALALEVLQKTALQLGRVPAARDLPPDVARRLTTDYGSVRFAYLALRIHAEGQAGTKTAEGAAAAAAEPLAMVSPDAFAATARMSETVGAAAAIAGQRLREQLAGALEHFVGEVTEIARHSTLAALVPTATDDEANAEPAASDEES
jgi:hypothetical protein